MMRLLSGSCPMVMRFLVFSFVVFFVTNSIAEQRQLQQPQTPGTIVGRVYQSDERTGVPNAIVTAIPVALLPGEQAVTRSATTDATGAYRITDLPPGLYNLTATAVGYQSVTKPNVRVDPAATVTVDIILPPQPGVVEGIVVRDEDGSPIGDALVEALYGGVVASSVRTASSGIYTLRNVPAGSVEIRVSAASYATQSRSITVPPGGIVTGVNFRLVTLPLGTLSGLVTRLIDGSVVGGVRIEVVDPYGKVIAFAITGSQSEEENGYRFNYRISVPSGTYTVRVATPGYSTSERRNVRIISGRETKGIDFAVYAFKTFKPGLHMLSLPYDYSKEGLNAADVIGVEKPKLATWVTDPKKPLGGEYAYFDPTNVNSPAYTFQLGRGYFLLTNAYLDFTREGTPAPSVYRFTIKLEAGWNLIGAPFTFTVDWLRSYVKPAGLEAIPITDLRARAFVNTALFTLREEWGGAETVGGYYQMATTLEPYKAYWVCALQPVDLLVDNQPVRHAGLRHPPQDEALKLLKAHIGNALLLRIKATSGILADCDNFVGIADNAGDGVDPFDIPEPPPFGTQKLNLSLIQPSSGGYVKCAADLRSRRSHTNAFFILIEGERGKDVTLAFEPVGELPRGIRVTLHNGIGNAIDVLLRRTYRFTLNDSARQFMLLLSYGMQSPLRILNLRQLPSRGNALMLGFTLTKPAQLRVSLMTLMGRMVMRIEPSKIYGAGENTLSIRLLSGLPNGWYLVRLEAVDVANGLSASATTRLSVGQ